MNSSPGINAVLGNGLQSLSYIATLSTNITVGSISTVNGSWQIALNGNALTLDSSSDSTLALPINGNGSVIKSNTGSITFSSASGFTGGTTISGGALLVGISSAFPSGSTLTLNGGNLGLAGSYNQTFSTALSLTASSAIDFGGVGSNRTISFGDSSAQSWSGNLSILNYAQGDVLRFGSSNSALTAGQLAAISFNGSAAQIDASGFVTPVPEPATYAALLGGSSILFAGLLRRRSVRAKVDCN